MLYKIGEVSKLLNIPVETIRYYEEKGFIHPFKDKNSGYRYFDAWDINFLMEYKKYRSMEFSQKDILEIQREDSIDEIKSKLLDIEKETEYKITKYRMLKKKLNETNKILCEMDDYLNQYKTVDFPDTYFIENRQNFEYNILNSDRIAEWMKYYPFAENTITIRENKISWGFSLEKQTAEIFNVNVSGAELIKAHKSLYTVIKAGQKQCLAKRLVDICDIDKREGVIGNLLLRAYENGEYVRYIQLWIPVEKNT